MGAIKDKIVGTAKQVEGKLTGDKVRSAQGGAQKTKGKIEAGASRMAAKVKAAGRKIERKMRGVNRKGNY